MLNYRYELKRSLYLLFLLLVVHLGAIATLGLYPISWWMGFIVSGYCLFSLGWSLDTHHWFNLRSSPMIRFWQNHDGTWTLEARNGKIFFAKLIGDSVSTLALVVLHFKLLEKRKKISVIILPDTLQKDEFRRLRVQLRTTSQK